MYFSYIFSYSIPASQYTLYFINECVHLRSFFPKMVNRLTNFENLLGSLYLFVFAYQRNVRDQINNRFRKSDEEKGLNFVIRNINQCIEFIILKLKYIIYCYLYGNDTARRPYSADLCSGSVPHSRWLRYGCVVRLNKFRLALVNCDTKK